MADISQILVGAMKDVEDAKVPDDLREIAFKEAIRLREASVGLTTGGGDEGPGSGGGGSSKATGEGAIAQIASRFGVDAAQVGEVFTERDGEVLVAIGTKALSSGKRPATKEIALLVAGARQATRVEDWTAVNKIREWCEEYGKYDGPNFAKTVAHMDDLFQFTGKGQKREVRLRQPAWEAAGELIRRIVGVSEDR